LRSLCIGVRTLLTRRKQMEPSNNNSSESTAAKTQPQHSDSRPALSSKCSQQCQDWVSWALLNSTSRPRQLLNAMGGRAVRDETTGNFSVSLDKKPQRRKESASSSTASTSTIVLSHPHPDVPDTAAARRLIASSVETKEHPYLCNPNTNKNIKQQSIGATRKSSKGMEISCAICSEDGPEGAARAFVKGPNPIAIVLCANRLNTKEEVEEVLVHELMHVYDVRVRQMDLRDCMQLAHSEVRAAREAECHSSARFLKSICVKDRATIATKNMFPVEGKECVRQVFEKAFKDNSPFASSSNHHPLDNNNNSFKDRRYDSKR